MARASNLEGTLPHTWEEGYAEHTGQEESTDAGLAEFPVNHIFVWLPMINEISIKTQKTGLGLVLDS